MSAEMETAAAASAGAIHEPRANRAGEPCQNCGFEHTAEYCPKCGQLQASFKRPLFSLILEGIRDAFALDGRIARTLPTLLFRPGRMTRDYLDGKRARYVPPFRLFLLSSLVFFLTLFSTVGLRLINLDENNGSAVIEMGSGAPDTGGADQHTADSADDWFKPGREFDFERMEADIRENSSVSDGLTEATVWFFTKLGRAYENEALFQNILQGWAPRISFLQMPIFALILGLLYAWRRRIYLYDHVITSLHLQSFFYITTTVVVLLGSVTGGGSALTLLVIPPVYIYRQLRVGYGDGRIMAALRTIILILLALLVIALLMLVLVLAGLVDI